ncbi:exonuclease SbcC [Microbacterium proteolyticum]|uniref:Nuclease SbcCD subunit C n=1 Tax=Microbacterium proteolyticum TaxID=1572644 RepID=A0A7W5GH00_9MICO|nr:SMC family ATPase [Microbacterium proteolyticum]MBB3159295.1 exonuclease SbcC [Microbacterium proteolyticum]
MKLHRLELEGFGPFLEAQEVDFDAFADDGIFLITGRTGAGKSSVLDGVCYALYGGVPRYDGAERRLRSDHCDPDDTTRVTLEFSAEGERWRVTRSPEFERPKRRGGGTTREPHRALLEVLAPEGWTGVAARPVDVAARLDEILGLTQQQFLQVILLAQNRFARFLLAKNDERLTLLRTLFGTRSFEQYAADLDERRKRASERLAAEGVEVATLLDEAERLVHELDEREPDSSIPGDDEEAGRSVSERLALVVRAVERADYRVDTLARENQVVDARLDAALLAEREARSLAERQRDRLGERERLAVLEADADAIAAIRREAAAAADADELRPAIETAEAARRAYGLADERLIDADAGVRAVDEVLADDADPRSRDDVLTAFLSRGEAALKVERELTDLDRDVNRLQARVDAVDVERQKLAVERLEVPDLLRALDDRLAELAGADARRDAALALRDETSRRLDAAREAARLLDQRDQADLASLVRADDLQRAIDAWTTLLRRRLSGAAVELAHELVDGEPCAVCGAREHPQPARGSEDPVSDADLAAAEDRKNAAVEGDRLASDAARVARDAHALAAALAGGESIEVLRARLATADDALVTATADVDEYERVRGDRTRAADLDAAITRRLDTLGAELAIARQDLALAQQRAEALGGEVDAARGGFDTVAARQDDLHKRRDAVRELIAARAAAAAARDTRRDADSAVAALVAESPFDDVAAVTAALRSAAHRRRLDTAAAEYDAALTATRQRLFDLELLLVDAGDEPIDLAPSIAEVASAREAVQMIAASHAGARARADRLRSLAQRADAGHAAVASLADEHAVVARLADTVAGRAPNTRRMTLETFVLAAELEEIVTAANLRLEHMSAGRYRLQHTDALAARGASSGLGLEIMDAFTGQCRPPQSLSGGETFLTSLALALGLAEVVTARAGGLRLDTLFIDEGFGSLDDDTLDLAMRTLDELRQGGRTVGVISHVASMRDQLPAQLHVTATPRGPSVIHQDVVLARA